MTISLYHVAAAQPVGKTPSGFAGLLGVDMRICILNLVAITRRNTKILLVFLSSSFSTNFTEMY